MGNNEEQTNCTWTSVKNRNGPYFYVSCINSQVNLIKLSKKYSLNPASLLKKCIFCKGEINDGGQQG